MKNKKGFTMVELLGIVAIIATILVFTGPSIVGMLKKDEEKEYNRFLEDLYLATETYVQLHSDKYPELSNIGGTSNVMIEDLIENGYIKASIVNPKTDEIIKKSDIIVVTKEDDGSYKYTYITE